MSWTRLDDRWTDRKELSAVSYEIRWHYLAMIQFCSRTDRIDGYLRLADARRCSDVEDADGAHTALVALGLVERVDGGLRLIEIGDHVPPPSVRMSAEKTKDRVRRHRAHKAGDHSLCLPDHCEFSSVTSDVTRYPGTGQDGTGQAPREGVAGSVDVESEVIDEETGEVSGWPPVADTRPLCPHLGCAVRLTGIEQIWGRCRNHRQEQVA